MSERERQRERERDGKDIDEEMVKPLQRSFFIREGPEM